MWAEQQGGALLLGGNSSSSYVKPFDPATELGVQESVGFWDGNEATFKRRRSIELKHGRVSKAAAVGYIIGLPKTRTCKNRRLVAQAATHSWP